MEMQFDPKDPLAEAPEADPKELYAQWEQAVRGYKQFCAVAAAVRLRLFDALENEGRHDDLPALLGTTPALTEDLCGLLAEAGLLERSGESFSNTPVSRAFFKQPVRLFPGRGDQKHLFRMSLWQQLDQICLHGPVKVDEAAFLKTTSSTAWPRRFFLGSCRRQWPLSHVNRGFPTPVICWIWAAVTASMP